MWSLVGVVVLLVANYYLATFCIWFGHWFSHLKGGPLTRMHVSGHHVLYPNSREVLSAAFRYASWNHDSTITLLPWLMVANFLEYLLMPGWLFIIALSETVVLMTLITYVHQQFHLVESRLMRFEWFRSARSLHALHHDRDVNFMVADHSWDRLMRTYCQLDDQTPCS